MLARVGNVIRASGYHYVFNAEESGSTGTCVDWDIEVGDIRGEVIRFVHIDGGRCAVFRDVDTKKLVAVLAQNAVDGGEGVVT